MVISLNDLGRVQQLFRQLLKLVDQGSGWERRQGWRWLPELVGEFPGCRERQNTGLAIPSGCRRT